MLLQLVGHLFRSKKKNSNLCFHSNFFNFRTALDDVQDILTAKPRKRFSHFNRPVSSRVDNMELTNVESADPLYENIAGRQNKEPVSLNDNAISFDTS